MQIEQLRFKSELIDRDDQVEQLMGTLADKGEETGRLFEQLLDLKNQMLDMSLFEETYHVTLVPIVGRKASPMQQ